MAHTPTKANYVAPQSDNGIARCAYGDMGHLAQSWQWARVW